MAEGTESLLKLGTLLIGYVLRLDIIIRLAFLVDVDRLVLESGEAEDFKGKAQLLGHAGAKQLGLGDVIETLE
mgnify:CR=1 FL=1